MDKAVNSYINWQEGVYVNGDLSTDDSLSPVLTLGEKPVLPILQVAFDIEKLEDVNKALHDNTDLYIPPPLITHYNPEQNIRLLRIEPLKVWILNPPTLFIEMDGVAILDISDSHVCCQIYGKESANLLNKHLPLDLRAHRFQVGSMASTAFHHCRVIIYRDSDKDNTPCFSILLPRGFAKSLAELLIMSANQFCYAIKNNG